MNEFIRQIVDELDRHAQHKLDCASDPNMTPRKCDCGLDDAREAWQKVREETE